MPVTSTSGVYPSTTNDYPWRCFQNEITYYQQHCTLTTIALPCKSLKDTLGACRHNDNKYATPKFQQCSQPSSSSSPLLLLSSPSPSYHHHHHCRLQGLGLLARSDPWVSRTAPFISSMIGLTLFFLSGGNQSASEEFGQLASISCIPNGFIDIYFKHRLNICSSCRIPPLLACYRSQKLISAASICCSCSSVRVQHSLSETSDVASNILLSGFVK